MGTHKERKIGFKEGAGAEREDSSEMCTK